MVKNDLENLLKRDDIGVEVKCGLTRLFYDSENSQWVVKLNRKVLYRGYFLDNAVECFDKVFEKLGE